ncbi:MAG TPA: hypothetical protein VGV09_12195 [Steroidobacteraceae bacterium]|nr:hypothetical protein [Steroidobacteraceae bacterium]
MVMVMVMIMVMVMAVIAALVVVTVTMVPIESAVPIIMPVARHIFAVVPIIANEVHGPTAGVIFRTVARPVLLLSRPYVQVDGLVIERRISVDDHGAAIDQRGGLRHIADIDLAKETRFANVNGHPDIGGHRRCGDE